MKRLRFRDQAINQAELEYFRNRLIDLDGAYHCRGQQIELWVRRSQRFQAWLAENGIVVPGDRIPKATFDRITDFVVICFDDLT